MRTAAAAAAAKPAGRSLAEISKEIRADWPNVYFGAVPYLDAMETMTRPGAPYVADSEWEVIIYFLSNATGWRGPKAREIKAELKGFKGRDRR